MALRSGIPQMAYAASNNEIVQLHASGSGESWALDLKGLTPTSLIDMVCIGKDVPVGAGDSSGTLSDIYVSPVGQVLIIESIHRQIPIPDLIEERMSELSAWGSDMLDDIAYGYFFRKDRQAALVIDAMCKYGLLTYRDRNRLSYAINLCFSSNSFIYILFVNA